MTKDFHERFEITVPVDEARKRFVNRAMNVIFSEFFIHNLSDDERYYARLRIATALGQRYSYNTGIDHYIQNDFVNCLQAIEAFHGYLDSYDRVSLNIVIETLLGQAEVDLGVKWGNGKFIKTGAKLLDDKLINDPLRWLRKVKFEGVLSPYEKGLRHFIESEIKPELLSDVTTDMYEALESLAKIVVGNDRDLSANRESFIKQVNASEAYKAILKDYISYANNFRHGLNEAAKKPILSIKEVESFVYLTGIFIRLAIKD